MKEFFIRSTYGKTVFAEIYTIAAFNNSCFSSANVNDHKVTFYVRTMAKEYFRVTKVNGSDY